MLSKCAVMSCCSDPMVIFCIRATSKESNLSIIASIGDQWGHKAIMFVTGVRSLKIITCLLTNKKFQTSVEFCRYFPNDSQEVDVSDSWFLLKHEIHQMGPMFIDETIGEREAEKDCYKPRDLVTPC